MSGQVAGTGASTDAGVQELSAIERMAGADDQARSFDVPGTSRYRSRSREYGSCAVMAEGWWGSGEDV